MYRTISRGHHGIDSVEKIADTPSPASNEALIAQGRTKASELVEKLTSGCYDEFLFRNHRDVNSFIAQVFFDVADEHGVLTGLLFIPINMFEGVLQFDKALPEFSSDLPIRTPNIFNRYMRFIQAQEADVIFHRADFYFRNRKPFAGNTFVWMNEQYDHKSFFK